MARCDEPLPRAEQERARVVLGAACDPAVDEAALPHADLDEDRCDELGFGSEVIEQHAGARADGRRERPQRELGERPREHIVDGRVHERIA